MRALVLSYVLLLSVTSNGYSQNMENVYVLDKLSIYPIEHATMVLSWEDKTIYVDPVGGADLFDKYKKPDFVLVTDIHGDHLNIETLERLPLEKSILITPEAVADKLPESLRNKTRIINNGEALKIFDVGIEAIPMYNLRPEALGFHEKGRGNGYVLTLGAKKIYISGDTEDIQEMRTLKNIDVAMVCMNLPYTMPVSKAADAVLEFKPKHVLPYHYRGKPDMSDVQLFKKLVNDSNPSIDVVMLNWYPK